MAWSPISLFVPQFEATTGLPASGYVLKAYQAGTSTNTPMATDSTGATQVTSIALNADGYPSVSGNIVIPHIDQSFKLALYPTQAAADANTGAKWTIDNLTPISNIGFANSVNSQTTNYTLQAADEGKLIYYSGAGGVTLDLPAVADAGDGFVFLVENDTSGTVTVDPDGSEQINGAATLVIAIGQHATIICNGTSWRALDPASLSANNNFPGDTTFSGTVTMSGTAAMSSKSLWMAEGANVASTADCNIWTTDGNTIHVTGTTQIDDWGTAPQAGATKRVIFDDALLLNYHATTNDLPTDADITTAAGDSCIVYARSTSSYQIFDYTRANGTALAVALTPGLVKLNSGSVSAGASAEIVMTSYTAYPNKLLKLYGVLTATNEDGIYMTYSTDGGSNYLTGASDYGWTGNYQDDQSYDPALYPVPASDNADSKIQLDLGLGLSNSTTDGYGHFNIELFNTTETGQWGGRCIWSGNIREGGVGRMHKVSGIGELRSANDVNAIKIAASSGNITLSWALYGYN